METELEKHLTDFQQPAHASCVQLNPLSDGVVHTSAALSIPRALAALDHALLDDSLNAISTRVAQVLKVEHSALLGKSRVQHIAFCRQAAMFLCRKLTGSSFPNIGEHFSRDHSTVIWACQTIEKRMADPVHGPQFTKLILQLEHQVATTPVTTEVAA
jgi:chromosomal replication initiation ATPase DnaA